MNAVERHLLVKIGWLHLMFSDNLHMWLEVYEIILNYCRYVCLFFCFVFLLEAKKGHSWPVQILDIMN